MLDENPPHRQLGRGEHVQTVVELPLIRIQKSLYRLMHKGRRRERVVAVFIPHHPNSAPFDLFA